MELLSQQQRSSSKLKRGRSSRLILQSLYFLLTALLAASFSKNINAASASLSLQESIKFQTATAHLQYWAMPDAMPSASQWLSRDNHLWRHAENPSHKLTSRSMRLLVSNNSDTDRHYIIDARQVNKNKAAATLIGRASLQQVDVLYGELPLYQPLRITGPNLFELTLPAQSIALLGFEYRNNMNYLPQTTLWHKNAFDAAKSESSNTVFFLAGLLIAYFILASINAIGTKQYISAIGALFAFSAIFSNNILLNHLLALTTLSVSSSWLTYSATLVNLIAFVFITVWLMPRSRYKELLNKKQWLFVVGIALVLPLVFSNNSHFILLLALPLLVATTVFISSTFYYLSDYRYGEIMLISAIKVFGTLAQLWLLDAFASHIVACFSYIFYTTTIHVIETTAILSLTLYLVRKEQTFLYKESIEVAKEEQKIATLSPLIHASRHDLREPLSDIIGLSELINDRPLDQTQRENIHAIQNVAKTALEKINSLFSYNYPSQKISSIHPGQFQLASLVRECSSFYNYQLKENDAELIIDFDNSVPEKLEGDQDTLRQILLYIFEQVALAREADSYHINVDYNDEHLRIQFDAPQTLLSGRSYNNHAQPLLLNTLIQKARGHIEVPANQKKLSITLPMQSPDSTALNLYDNTLTKGKHVLVIDDNPAACNVIASYLERWRIYPHVAHDFAQAQAIVHHQNNIGAPIDLIVVDFLLDSINGLELLDALEQSKNKTSPPVVLMSNALDLIDLDAARQRDIYHILEKPVMPETLQAAIIESFHLQKTLAESRPITSVKEQINTHTNKSNVLVVEDNPISIKIITALLKRYGNNYEIAKTAAQALTLFKQNDYGILLLDCQLPDTSGFSLAKKIRQIENSRAATDDATHDLNHCIIIGMSADANDQNKARALEIGMDHYFSKPVTGDNLDSIFSA